MLAKTLSVAAQRFAERTAYVDEAGRTLTYGALRATTERVAAGLHARGIGEGDVIAIVLPPSIEYAVAYLAAARIGAVTAGVNHRLRPPEQAAILERAGPALVISDAQDVAGDRDCVVCDRRHGEILGELAGHSTSLPEVDADPNRPVAIVFTSGTTGTPKGALYCNRQLEFITDTDVGDAWGSGGRSYTATSFAHLGFMTKLPGQLRRGATQLILEQWRAELCLELVARERLQTIAGVPAQLALMLARDDFDQYDLSSVQLLVTGGGPLTPALARAARRRFSAPLATRYSCTEAGIGLGTAPDAPDEDAEVSVGRPHPAVELTLRTDDDRRVGDGEVGEVCLRSPAVMEGYWDDPGATVAVFADDGAVRTGDLGWLDTEGRLRLVGRASEMYIRGGYNVHPVEVESVLSEHPGVRAIAIVPRPDPVMGEIGVAVIVPTDRAASPDVASLRAHGTEQLAAYKLPESVVVIEEMPLTAMEKLDRAALRALVSDNPLP